MKNTNRMIFQVAVGPQSKLYEHCIESVKNYCAKHDITHRVLTAPQLWIKPDPFNSGRSEESYMKYGGYLPVSYTHLTLPTTPYV